jgi:hypothetical protein
MRTTRFNIHKFYVLATQCIYVFCVDLRTNSDYCLYSINWLALGAFAKLRKAPVSSITSVRPRGTTPLPLDGFSWNLVLEDFLKICLENSDLVKIFTRIRVLYTFMIIFHSMRNVSDESRRDSQNTRFMFNSKILSLYIALTITPLWSGM